MRLQANLAMCCKAMLPILCVGTVDAWLDNRQRSQTDMDAALVRLSRFLERQPSTVSNLNILVFGKYNDMRRLIDLRCAHTVLACMHDAGICVCRPCLCQCLYLQHVGWGLVLILSCANAGC